MYRIVIFHGGDNNHALNVSLSKSKYWCKTASCEKSGPNSLIGFCRLALSVKYCNWKKLGDNLYSFHKTIQYLKGLYEVDGLPRLSADKLERSKWAGEQGSLVPKINDVVCTMDEYTKSMTITSQYFLSRGFSEEVLNKYYVRHYPRTSGRFAFRSVIPQLDVQGRNVLGITGRTECSYEPKWVFSDNFPAGTSLYNYREASDYIRRRRSVILVEGPLDVFKLEMAGIHHSVGLWGTSLSESKRFLLDKLGVMQLVLALDNDQPGIEAAKVIQKNCSRLYNTTSIVLPTSVKDVGDLYVDQIKELFREYI